MGDLSRYSDEELLAAAGLTETGAGGGSMGSDSPTGNTGLSQYSDEELLSIAKGGKTQEEKGFWGKLFDYADVGASGVVRGATNALGLPVDAVNSLLGAVGLGSEKPIGGSQFLRETIMPNEPQAKGYGQQITKAVGEQLGGAAVPVAGSLTKTGMSSKLLNALVGNLNELPLSSLLKAQALTATGAGVGSGIAREAFPDSVTADIIGQLVGGIGAPGTAALVNKAIKTAKAKVTDPLFNVDQDVSQKLKTMLGENPIYQNNWRAAEDVATEIPGLRPTLGQSTNAPNAIVTERSLMRKGGGMANDAIDLNRQNMQAVREFGEGIIPEGSIENTAGAVSGKLNSLQEEVNSLLARATAGTPDKQGAGKTIYGSLKQSKEGARQEAKALFDQIEQSANPKLDATGLRKTLSDVGTPMHSFEGPEDYPEIIPRLKKFFEKQTGDETVRIGKGGEATDVLPAAIIAKNPQLQEALGGATEISFKDLRGLRSEIASEIRKEKAFPQPNDKKLSRLATLQKSVQNTLDQLSDEKFITEKGYDPELRDMYESAVKTYKEKYVPYKQGATRDVLRAGPSGEEPSTPYSAIAGKFFKSGRGAREAAQEFIKNAGSRDEAKNALEGYVYRDLIEKATGADGAKLDSKKYAQWFKSHQEALGEFPELRSELLNLKSAQAKVDEIVAISKPFEGDSDRIMGRILTAKNPNEEMNRLTRVIRDDPGGIEGLRKSFWNEALNKSTTRRVDIAGEQMLNPAALKDHMKKYSGVYSKLYSQEERQAMDKVQKAYEIIMRTDKTPLGTGSDTAENINNAASLAAWAGMRLFGSRSFMLAAPIAKIIGNIPQEKRLALLEEALLNPEVAKNLLSLPAKEPGKAMLSIQKLANLTKSRGWMINLPRAGGDKEED